MKNKKNYVILTILLIVTIAIVWYALRWYDVYREAYKSKAIITSYISEIKTDEFNNYLNDKRNVVIYFGLTYDENCRAFERSFRNTIAKYQLEDEIVYFSINGFEGSDYATKLNIKYNTELNEKGRYLSSVPTLAIFEDTKVVDFVSNPDLNKDSAVKLLMEYNIINNWD